MSKLLLDTSQPYIMAAVVKDGYIFEKIFAHNNQLGLHLSHEIKKLIESASLGFKDLTEIRVGVGPGSYTGTRVGVAFAESLGFGLDIPVIKIPSLLFYLTSSSTRIALKSNFDTCGVVWIDQGAWHYQLMSKDACDHSEEILDPKKPPISPQWSLLLELTSPSELKELLYFSIK